MEKYFLIGKSEEKIRLDKFLKNQFKNFSRAYLQKLIKQGLVLVNNRAVKPNYSLAAGDKIGVQITETPTAALILEPDTSIPLEILYEDNDVIVINKQAGLSVHPSQSTPKGTLANALLARYPEIKNVGEDPLRPGIVHRLDKDTSGVILEKSISRQTGNKKICCFGFGQNKRKTRHHLRTDWALQNKTNRWREAEERIARQKNAAGRNRIRGS